MERDQSTSQTVDHFDLISKKKKLYRLGKQSSKLLVKSRFFQISQKH